MDLQVLHEAVGPTVNLQMQPQYAQNILLVKAMSAGQQMQKCPRSQAAGQKN